VFSRKPRSGRLQGRMCNSILTGRKRSALALILAMFTFASALAFTVSAQEPQADAKLQAIEKSGSQRPPAPSFVPGEVLVRYRTETIAKQKESRIDSIASEGRRMQIKVEPSGGESLVKGLRMVRVQPEETISAIKALSRDPEVLYAEPNYIWRKEQTALTPNDPNYGSLWGLKNTGQVGNNDLAPAQPAPQAGVVGADIKAEQAWGAFSTGSNNVVVAVIDEGIDINHPDLQANIWQNPGETPNDGIDNDGNGYIDDVNGWDFAHNDKTVFDNTAGVYPVPDGYTGDVDDHGTHVAGTIGARGNNGVGVVGVNWQVKIMSVKVLGAGGGSTSNIIKGYEYVRKMLDLWQQSGGTKGANVRITNNSYGGTSYSQAARDAISALGGTAPDNSILFVAAAGNESENSAEFSHYPSDYILPNVLSVAATDRFEQLATFSNYGAQQVMMAAPGRGILSTTPYATYNSFSGTSMASPHVTGAAALCLASFPNTGATALREALMLSGDVLPSLAGKVYSQRRLNVYEALRTLSENDKVAPTGLADLHVVSQNGRTVTLAGTAPGDDGGTGRAALYAVYADSTFIGTKVPSGPAGTPETFTLNVPYLRQTSNISIRLRDNAGFDAGGGGVIVNSTVGAVNPYTVSLGANAPLSTGGTALDIVGDDKFKENVALPFAFPFYGENKTSATISSNGVIYFSKLQRGEDSSTGETFGLDAISSPLELARHKIIAGLWDDLVTTNVFMVQPDANHVIFRWEGTAFENNQPISFETELRIDGTIVYRYGSGNTGLHPVVGISPGEPDPYVVQSHTMPYPYSTNLTNAQSVIIAPRVSVPSPTPTPTPTPAPTPTPTPSTGQPVFFDFSTFNYTVDENVQSGVATLTVSRAGDTSTAVSVDYSTSDSAFSTPCQVNNEGYASERCDYATAVGTLRFAPGEVTKTISIPIINDSYMEPAQGFNIMLRNAQGGSVRNSQAFVNIIDDDKQASSANPIDNQDVFIKQQYIDFLGRVAEPDGFNFWKNRMSNCPPGDICDRTDTSQRFFQSDEFQERGFYVYRLYDAVLGRLPRYTDFVYDVARLNGFQTPAEQRQSKDAYLLNFVQSMEFRFMYGQYLDGANGNSLTSSDPAGFVNALCAKSGIIPASKQSLINNLQSGARTPAQTVEDFILTPEMSAVGTKFYDRGFITMQYFGYLRRDPEQAGFDFWQQQLIGVSAPHRQDYRFMVGGFLQSDEYRFRFALISATP
jgi:subtilisin family serine protease